MFDKRTHTQVAIAELIARRWSGRAFDPARPVPHGQLIAVLEAARWAPSCFGEQPWRYIVWDRFADPDRWDQAFATLSDGNQAWAKAAPLLILALAADAFQRDLEPNRWGQYDTGGATMNLCLQATALGLMVHQMGGFDPRKAQENFSLPGGFTPMAMIAIGYQLPQEAIPEALKEREHAPRMRRPLGETFFYGRWGDAIIDPACD